MKFIRIIISLLFFFVFILASANNGLFAESFSDFLYTARKACVDNISDIYNEKDYDDIRDHSVKCWPNGNPRLIITYQDDGLTKKIAIRYSERLGEKKAHILYRKDGTKKTEYLYYEEEYRTFTIRVDYNRSGEILKYGYSREYLQQEEPCL